MLQNWKIPLNCFHFDLTNWFSLSLSGTDARTFLQNQTTQDLSQLVPDGRTGMWSARLTPKGKLCGYFFVVADEACIRLYFNSLIPREIRENLERNLISEDVVIGPIEPIKQSGIWGVIPTRLLGDENHFLLIPYAGGVLAILDEKIISKIGTVTQMSAHDQEQIEAFGLLPLSSDLDWERGRFINETILEEFAISYNKGCFTGQETVAKIHNLRGATRFPVLIKLSHSVKSLEYGAKVFNEKGEHVGEFVSSHEVNGTCIWRISSVRSIRVENLNFIIKLSDSEHVPALVLHTPLWGGYDLKAISQWYFQQSTQLYSVHNEVDKAIEILEFCLFINPNSLEALEVLGVIQGKLGRFEKAIDLMNILVSKDPDTVMAYTNLSLFHMKLGHIQLAEDFKAKSLLNEFKKNTKIPKDEKSSQQKQQEQISKLENKVSLFKQVLDLDPEDDVANYGLGEIYHLQDKTQLALEHLNKAIISNPKNARALLLRGKILGSLGHRERAIESLELARSSFLAKGDSRQAGEAQSLLNQFAING